MKLDDEAIAGRDIAYRLLFAALLGATADGPLEFMYDEIKRKVEESASKRAGNTATARRIVAAATETLDYIFELAVFVQSHRLGRPPMN